MRIRTDRSKTDSDKRRIQMRFGLQLENDRLNIVFEPCEFLEARMIFES